MSKKPEAPAADKKGKKPEAPAAAEANPELATIRARIAEIGDPSAPRMRLGKERAELRVKHKAIEAAMFKEASEADQAIRVASKAEIAVSKELEALKLREQELTAAMPATSAEPV